MELSQSSNQESNLTTKWNYHKIQVQQDWECYTKKQKKIESSKIKWIY